MMSSDLCNPLLYMEIMKRKHPEVFREWCCTELSHVLDFSGTDGLGQVLMGNVDVRRGKTIIKKFSRKKKIYDENFSGSIFGAPLSEKGFSQARQLIQYLKKFVDHEGIFRIPGNSGRQQKLRDKIDSGAVVDLDSGEFTANDVACVLKAFLGDLPEPLVTDRQYEAHKEAAGLTYKMGDVPNLTPGMRKKHQVKCMSNHIKALKYLFFLLPSVNFKLLRELFELLKEITEREENNKMTSYNLGMIFAPHVIWPRYFTTEDLRDQNLVKQLNYSVEFIIDHFHQVFNAPTSLLNRCEKFVKYGQLQPEDSPERKNEYAPPTCKREEMQTTSVPHHPRISAPECPSVTVPSAKRYTENAIAELFQEVQAMPPGPKKRRLMKQLYQHKWYRQKIQAKGVSLSNSQRFAKSSHLPNTPDHVREELARVSREGHGRHRRSKSVGESLMKQVSTPFHHKKKRPAPAPPENSKEALQLFNSQKGLNIELASRLPTQRREGKAPRQRTKSVTNPPPHPQRELRSNSVPSPADKGNTAFAMLQNFTSKDTTPVPKRPAPRLEDSPAFQDQLRNRNTPLGMSKRSHGKRPVPMPRSSTPVDPAQDPRAIANPRLPQPLAEPSRPRPSPRKPHQQIMTLQSTQTIV